MGQTHLKLLQKLQREPDKEKHYHNLFNYFDKERSGVLDAKHSEQFFKELFEWLHPECKSERVKINTLNSWYNHFDKPSDDKFFLSWPDFHHIIQLVRGELVTTEIVKSLEAATPVTNLENKSDSDFFLKLLGHPEEKYPNPHPVFGVPLKDLCVNSVQGTPISQILRSLLSYLCSSDALDKPEAFDASNFRAKRSKATVKYLRKLFDEGESVDLSAQKADFSDVFTLLLEFLSQIPEPIIPPFYEALMVIEIMGQRYDARKKLEELIRKEMKEKQEHEASIKSDNTENKEEFEKKKTARITRRFVPIR